MSEVSLSTRHGACFDLAQNLRSGISLHSKRSESVVTVQQEIHERSSIEAAKSLLFQFWCLIYIFSVCIASLKSQLRAFQSHFSYWTIRGIFFHCCFISEFFMIDFHFCVRSFPLVDYFFCQSRWDYRKFPKYSNTQKICCTHSII